METIKRMTKNKKDKNRCSWCYQRKNGHLTTANEIKGIKNFNEKEFALLPIKYSSDALSSSQRLTIIIDKMIECHLLSTNSNMFYIAIGTRYYPIECNLKLFVENFFDGGYHIKYAHLSLASHLSSNDSYKMKNYCDSVVSIQYCQSKKVNYNNDKLSLMTQFVDEGVEGQETQCEFNLKAHLSKYNVADRVYGLLYNESITIDELITFTILDLKDWCNEHSLKTIEKKRRFLNSNSTKSLPNSQSNIQAEHSKTKIVQVPVF